MSSRRRSRPTVARSSARFTRIASGLCGSGSTSGLATQRFGATCSRAAAEVPEPPHDPPQVRALPPTGAASPIELSHSTRLSRARTRMTWVLLVGSSSQSLAKQTMFSPIM